MATNRWNEYFLDLDNYPDRNEGEQVRLSKADIAQLLHPQPHPQPRRFEPLGRLTSYQREMSDDHSSASDSALAKISE